MLSPQPILNVPYLSTLTNLHHYQPHHYQYHHNTTIGPEKLFFRNCRINSFNSSDHSWNAATAKLVAKWGKTVHNRRLHRLKRSMVKESRTCTSQRQPPGPTNAGVPAKYERPSKQNFISSIGERPEHSLVIADDKAHTEGSELCLAKCSARKEETTTQNEGSKLGDLSVDPMESNKKASAAARQSSHCDRDHKGVRGLTPDQFAARKKQEAVAVVMAAFHKWFDKRLQIISYAYEQSEASENSGGGTAGESGAGDGASGTGGSGRPTRTKRPLDGDDQDNSSAGGDEGDPNRGGSKRAKKDVELECKWACPFYKHDPLKYSKHRSCTGPGWPSLHRLKEHLYRIHREPKHSCVRCNKPFVDKKDLDDHLRADMRCEKMDLAPVQGIDPATEAKIKVRKKAGVTDEQRWREIYLILFPNTNLKAIPSPYYDGNVSLGSPQKADFSRMKKRIQKELPDLVQKRVERSFDKLEVEVKQKMREFIQDGLLEIFNDDGSPIVTPAVTPRAATPGLCVANDQSDNPVDKGDDSLDLWNLLEPDMPFPFGAFMSNDFDFTTQFGPAGSADCHNSEEQSDSGYASTCTARDAPSRAEV
ncbi:hypothetical protein F5B20DRAFT_216429 [Whalleya microplaca]|nr:hypothetical protein F5B20DRAFT_216429 [Whalleya microplaca]